MTLNIHRAVVADIPALVALNRIVDNLHAVAEPQRFRQNPPDQVVGDAFKNAIELPGSYWLLAAEEQAVGYLSAEFRLRPETWYMNSHEACYISAIVVVPQLRRQGVARALLAELKREAHARGVGRIELDVWAFNEDARKAFHHLGFRPVMERMALSIGAAHKTASPP